MRFATMPPAGALGAILAHAVPAPGLAFKKGRRLTADDLNRLAAAGVGSVTAALLEPGDVGEDEAAARLASALAGTGVRVDDAFTGRVNLHATAHGLCLVEAEVVLQLNQVDETITVATLPDAAVVTPGTMLATIKIIPFAAPRAALERALEIGRAVPSCVRVQAFRPLRARLVQTELPGTPAKVLDKTARVTGERLAALEGAVVGESRCPHEPAALARTIASLPEDYDLLLVVGASAITDRRDVIPAAIEAAGGTVEHFGMPVDPGNLLLLAHLHDRPALGLPGCARSPKLNGFDWVLQRLAAGLEVTGRDLMRMGVGGLLTEIPSRPQPRAQPAKQAAPRIAALVLAAGQSTRMGSRNKLLIELDDAPMVRHVVAAAEKSRTNEVVVVTGHDREAVEAALADRRVRLVHNPDFARGLSTSLKTGLSVLPADVDGVVVCLADMPQVTPALLDRLIAAFAPDQGRSIVVPVAGGRRGNPVLWGAAHLPAMRALEGDQGARDLIARNQEAVVEVEAGPEVLLDIDTPEALMALGEPAS